MKAVAFWEAVERMRKELTGRKTRRNGERENQFLFGMIRHSKLFRRAFKLSTLVSGQKELA
jgi:hypothetical protein